MNIQVPQEVLRFVRQQSTMSLGTVTAQGEPQVADLYYTVGNDMELYFVSSTTSRHVSNLRRSNRVAATIHADGSSWRDIRGVQIEGQCGELSGRAAAIAYARYVAAFPYVLSDPTLAKALRKVRIFRIDPDWIRWIDNSREFGDYLEIRL